MWTQTMCKYKGHNGKTTHPMCLSLHFYACEKIKGKNSLPLFPSSNHHAHLNPNGCDTRSSICLNSVTIENKYDVNNINKQKFEIQRINK